MLYTLLVTKGADAGLKVPLRAGKLSVGRAPDNGLILTDPSVLPRHFLVTFEDGGWRCVTFERKATVLVDRRWAHPKTGQRGARIFVGDSQLLLFPGEIDLTTARKASEGLDIDEETLRDEAVTTVGHEGYQFRYDMTGRAERVGSNSDRGRGPKGSPKVSEGPGAAKSRAQETTAMFEAGASMMRVPPGFEGSRGPGAPAGPSGPAPSGRGGRASWTSPAPSDVPRNRALVKGQQISLTDTAVGAMPSRSRDLAVLYDKDGAFAAELRILATRLEELKNTFGYRSFLVTSAGQGDGKTVLAANLALVMSEDPERRIALVDANFRAPRAADLFNLDKSRGILSAISGERSLSECVARVIGRNLIVLHAGGEHKNPAAVLSDPRFKALLAELSQAIDFMIIDAPAAIPHADVSLLTQHVDAVFMTVAAHKTQRAALDKALNTIGRSRVVGSIFVNHEPKPPKRKGKARPNGKARAE